MSSETDMFVLTGWYERRCKEPIAGDFLEVERNSA